MTTPPPSAPPPSALIRTQRLQSLASRRVILGSAAVGTLGVFGLHILLPALHAIRDALDSTDTTVQLLISLAIFATALGGLAIAPLSDRWGRRRIIRWALAMYFGGSLLGLIAPHIGVLIAARVLQAFGGGAALAVMRADVIDRFGTDGTAASAMAYSSTAVLIVPMIAPVLGGLVVQWLHWRVVFVLAMALAIGVLLFYERNLARPDDEQADKDAKPTLLASYRALIGTPGYVPRLFFGAAMMSTTYVFIASAPYLVIRVMGAAPAQYGLWYCLPASASFCGFLLAGRISRSLGSVHMMGTGLACMLIAVLAFALLSWAGVQQPLAVFVPGMLLTFGNALALPNTTSSTIALRADIAGAASGLLSFVQLTLAALATQLVAVFANHTSQPPALLMLGTMAGAALCFSSILWGRTPSFSNLHAK